jgi:glycosyltransferase involved in cell wall biosynthesis
MEKKGFARALLVWVEKLTAFPARRILVNSKQIKVILEKMNLGDDKVKMLGYGSSNGIDTDYFSRHYTHDELLSDWRLAQGAEPDVWVWLFVGRIVKDKGIVELTDAFLQLSGKFPHDQLWLVGPFEQELDPIPDEYLHKLQQHPNIRLFGFQNDVRPFMACAQALVFPSYREGFPNVPMQAAAMQLPLLLSNINGCNELVTHLENGFLFETKSVPALVDAMVYARTHEKALNHWKAAALKRIHTYYNQRAIWEFIFTEYQQLMPSKKVKTYVPAGN